MYYTKYIFKFNNHMLLESLNHYFTKLGIAHNYNTKQIQRNKFLQFCFFLQIGKKNSTSEMFQCAEKCPNEISLLFIFNV